MRIGPGQFEPEWGHAITLGGVEFPLLHPREVEDHRANRPGGLKHAFLRAARWAGRLWSTESDRAGLIREVEVVVPRELRPALGRLSSHELVTLRVTAQALMTRWYGELLERTMKAAQGAKPAEVAGGARGTTASASGAGGDGRQWFKISPGRPLPGIMGGGKWGRDLVEEPAAESGPSAKREDEDDGA